MDAVVTANLLWRDHSGRFASAVEAGAQQALIEGSQEGARLSMEFAPKRSGFLASTISPFIFGLNHVGWAVRAPYGLAQDLGARPHVIGAAGQLLANKEDGFGPVRGPVWHPGNPATRFMERAFSLVMNNIMSKVRRDIAW
jgi:hypothetical protein